MLKRTIFVFATLLLFVSGFAQTILVKKENARIRNEYGDGYEVAVEGNLEDAESALSKWMKTFGKTKKADNAIMVAEPALGQTTYTTPFYGQTKQVGNMVSVWFGIITDEWSKKDVEALNPELKKALHEFAANYQRERIQKQIDESLRAVQAVERQQQRLSNQHRDLNNKIENNKREKIQLEKDLENNKVELETLILRLEKNKNDQDSVAVAGEQIKKVVEMHRERQRQVN